MASSMPFHRHGTEACPEQVRAPMMYQEVSSGAVKREETTDDLSREVYCLLGLPIDAIEMSSVVRRIELAAAGSSPFVLSTPNLNFLANSQLDPEFRESLLQSDLCIADGMSIVWSARLLGIPIKERVAGSDILAALKAKRSPENPLRLFLFGGPEGVAAAASRVLNAQPGGVHCVGFLYPGFGTVHELSRGEVLDTINLSGADFLVTSLGSKKGQLWLKHNDRRLRIPVRAHLGASLSFEAGTVKRAPHILQKLGLEWLWRIKEEPYLWRRYWHDGSILLRLLCTRVLPLLVHRLIIKNLSKAELNIETRVQDESCVKIALSGPAIRKNISQIIAAFKPALATKKGIVIDFSKTSMVDARFLGLLLVLRGVTERANSTLALMGLSPELRRQFGLNGVDFLLLAPGRGKETAAVFGFPKAAAA